ncbi:MAG: quinolinate synthase NadA, partial [Hyphomicrobiales bacterium]
MSTTSVTAIDDLSVGQSGSGFAPETAASRFGILPMPDLSYTDEIAAATAPIYEKLKDQIPAIEWPVFAPLIYHINKIKKQRNAVILAHNYQTPEIFHGVADFVGDSLQLAIEASQIDEDI